MALIYCQQCGHQVSDQADSCPNCGHPISSDLHKSDSNNKTIIFILAFALLAAISAVAIFFAYKAGSSNQSKNDKTSPAVVAYSPASTKEETSTPSKSYKPARSAIKPGRDAYFVVVSSLPSLSEAKKKANEINGIVTKGFVKGVTCYRVCWGVYNSRSEAKLHVAEARAGYGTRAWVLPDNTSAIVYP